MIVSHQHRFIFVKTRKTAGTSIEVFLDRLAGPDAIVTPVVPAVPGHTPRHHDGPFNPLPQILATRRIRPALADRRRGRTFYNHMPASRIRERVGPRVWDSYFTFCFERNPWEKVLSWYWYRWDRHGGMDFEEFVRTRPLPSDWHLYTRRNAIAVDFVGRFERLTEDLTTALRHLGIDVPVTLTREKGGARPAGTETPRYSPAAIALVRDRFRREIETFGYPDLPEDPA